MKRCVKSLLLVALIGFVPLVMAQSPTEDATQTPVQTVIEGSKAAGSAVIETSRETVRGAAEAGSEFGGAVKSGTQTVVGQTKSLWRETVGPALERTSGALPSLIKAVILLIAFWIAALVVGSATTKILKITKLDNKAAKDLGLEKLLQKPDGTQRSLESLAGKLVKWLILLFGFVAFFNALNLQMVAGPLQNIIDKIVGVIPHLLKAALILFVYWAIATLLKLAVTKVLTVSKFDAWSEKYFPKREIKGEQVGAGALIGRLLFYIILLFGIPPFLDALGQQALVTPLQEMLAKALAFIPNIVAAAVILFIGCVVATIVRELTSNFLVAVGADEGVKKIGIEKMVGKKKLSDIIGLIVYFFILVPIIVAAVDALQIKAISDPVKATLETILTAIPAILVALIIISVGYAIAKVVRGLVENLLAGIGFDALPEKVGLSILKPKGENTLSSIIGTIVMAVILLLTAQQALASLGFDQLAELVNTIVRYLPHLAVGLIILFVTLSLAKYISNLVAKATSASPHSKLISNIARYAIIFLGAGMTLTQLGISEQIVFITIGSVLGGLSLALGLAFGLGGKEKAKELIESYNK